ncbi:uncharacterized protein [Nicotiana tomentosiformis]|uniref:uncharacterized protein n=1 Tax=Nicotiana tomentosiformis TaxID=4098 RepID=UPI00388CA473
MIALGIGTQGKHPRLEESIKITQGKLPRLNESIKDKEINPRLIEAEKKYRRSCKMINQVAITRRTKNQGVNPALSRPVKGKLLKSFHQGRATTNNLILGKNQSLSKDQISWVGKSLQQRSLTKIRKKGHANIVEKNDDIDDVCAMLLECNLVGNLNEWWIDSGPTRHVCAVKEAFATYSTAGPKEELSMGNTAATKIEGYGKIFLKMTSGKVLTLNNVLHVPTIRKNLDSTYLLVKN